MAITGALAGDCPALREVRPGAAEAMCMRPAGVNGQDRGMPDNGYSPSPENPLLILAMDHRASFGKSLFDVQDDQPDAGQLAAMQAAKQLIYAGLARAVPMRRRPGMRVSASVP